LKIPAFVCESGVLTPVPFFVNVIVPSELPIDTEQVVDEAVVS
jgi:hypothetical protein